MRQQNGTARRLSQRLGELRRRVVFQMAEASLLIPVDATAQIRPCQIQGRFFAVPQHSCFVAQNAAARLRHTTAQRFPALRRQVKFVVAHAEIHRTQGAELPQQGENRPVFRHITGDDIAGEDDAVRLLPHSAPDDAPVISAQLPPVDVRDL